MYIYLLYFFFFAFFLGKYAFSLALGSVVLNFFPNALHLKTRSLALESCLVFPYRHQCLGGLNNYCCIISKFCIVMPFLVHSGCHDRYSLRAHLVMPIRESLEFTCHLLFAYLSLPSSVFCINVACSYFTCDHNLASFYPLLSILGFLIYSVNLDSLVLWQFI